MHELALAEAVIATALDVASKEGMARITRLRVRIGELQRIEPRTFEFALREILPAAEPRLASTEILLRSEPARLRCRPCGREFPAAEAIGPSDEDAAEAIHFVPELAHAFLRCPGCRSSDFDVIEGRGVWLDSVEGS